MVDRQASVLPGSRISVPLYGQVLGVLRQRILDGVYAPGEQLQPEDRLAMEFGVSRATIRQAVGELVKEGLVNRRQGRGTFVVPADKHPYGQRFSGSLSDLIAETMRAKAITVDVQRRAEIPTRIAEALNLEEPVATVVRRTRAIEDQVFAYTVNYIPERYGELLSESDLHTTALMALLRERGVRLGSAQQVIRAEQADVEVCEWLHMEFAAPVLYAERLLLDTDGDPVQFVKTWYRADLYEYRVNLRADSDDDGVRFQLA